MKCYVKRYVLPLVLASFAVLLLAGCGESDQKNRDDKSALKKVPGLKERLAQLDKTLDQMDSEADLQKRRIKAAKEEVALLRDMFRKGRPADFRFEPDTSAAMVSVFHTPARVEEPVAEEDREEARDRFLETVVILLFGLFAGVYLIKLYKDRANAPANRAVDQPLSKTYDTASSPLSSDAPRTGIDKDEV